MLAEKPAPSKTTIPGMGHAAMSWMVAGIFSSADPPVPWNLHSIPRLRPDRTMVQHDVDPPLRAPEPPGHADLRSHLQAESARESRYRPFEIGTARDRILTVRHAYAGCGVTLLITYSSIGPRRAPLELMARRAGTW